MVSVLILLALGQSPQIERDNFGVPILTANSTQEVFYLQGYATAQDRLWQMELSRHQSQGRIAEILGPSGVASDTEFAKYGYTTEEIETQLNKLSPGAKEAFQEYARGVTAYIHDATHAGTLPPGYAKYKLQPEDWTARDSASISIRLLQMFGRMGSGEIRNWAFMTYLKAQPQVKGDDLFKITQDLLWSNDKDSPTTLQPEDDKFAHPNLPIPSRKDLERQFKALPKANIFELLPGVSLAAREESTLLAQKLNLPYKTGSYCIVVSPQRSKTGYPVLLSGPQMGLNEPSIVHEAILNVKGKLTVGGLAIPGVPGIAVGHTPNLAWGLTTGVADQEDIFISKKLDADHVQGPQGPITLNKIKRTIKVAGAPDQEITQFRTQHGPVVIQLNSGFVLSRRSHIAGQELSTFDGLFGIYSAKNLEQIHRSLSVIPTNFNFFYALRTGEIGWQYVGKVPLRSPLVDPRLPVQDTAENQVQGTIPFDQLPHVTNPKQGVISNWNNKPAAWWPNGDTPAWGAIFRVDEIRRTLPKSQISAYDLEHTIWSIARHRFDAPAFKGFFPKSGELQQILQGYDGETTDGSIPARAYGAWINGLRDVMFLPVTGDFLNRNTFLQAVQEAVVLRAMQGKTEYPWLAKRAAAEVSALAAESALLSLKKLGDTPASWRYKAGGPRYEVAGALNYGDRGTYIQICDVAPWGVSIRSILPPGEAESGVHASDQKNLAQGWLYKHTWTWPVP